MEWQLIIDCVLVAIGAGLVYGIFGGGSGIIMMPGFYYVLRHFQLTTSHQMQMAIGTTALASALLGIAAVRAQSKKKNIDFSIVKKVWIGIGIGTVSAVFLLNVIPSHLLKHLFGVVVIAVAAWLFFYRQDRDLKKWTLSGLRNMIFNILIGLLWFLFGIAVFTVPYLHKCGLDMRRAVGCATFISTLFSWIAGILLMITGIQQVGVSSVHIGFVNLVLVLISVIPSALAAHFGSHISHKLPQSQLRIVYSTLVALVGILMLISKVG